jgi:hypothetical protein
MGAEIAQYNDWAVGCTTGVRFQAGARNFSLFRRVLSGSGDHTPSYSVGTDSKADGRLGGSQSRSGRGSLLEIEPRPANP